MGSPFCREAHIPTQGLIPFFFRAEYLGRYFKQDGAVEITARDTLVKGYIKLKLNTSDGLPLDDKEDPDSAAGEMTLDKVRVGLGGGYLLLIH